MRGILGVACALSVMAFGCDDSDPATGGGGGSASGMVGADGGEVTAGDAKVEISPGALSEDTEISVSELSAADTPDAPDGYGLAGPAIVFTPHGTKFDEDVRLTLPFDSDSDDLVILKLDDEDDTSWERVEGGKFRSSDASLVVTSFSVYAVAEGDAADDSDAGSPDASGGGGKTDSGGGGEATAGCTTQCEAETRLDCANDPALDDCITRCVEESAAFQTGVCTIDAVSFGDCVAKNLDDGFECDEDGEASLKDGVCGDEQGVFFGCITTGVNSKGDEGVNDGTRYASCSRKSDTDDSCSDYYGGLYSVFPVDGYCGGEEDTVSEDACSADNAIGKCHVDDGGLNDSVHYFYPVDQGVDGSRKDYCEMGLMGDYTAL